MEDGARTKPRMEPGEQAGGATGSWMWREWVRAIEEVGEGEVGEARHEGRGGYREMALLQG